MARTHAEVREAAREEAFEEARRIENENYTRHLTDRASRVVAQALFDFMKTENYGHEPKHDFMLDPNGNMRVQIWMPNARPFDHRSISIVLNLSVKVDI